MVHQHPKYLTKLSESDSPFYMVALKGGFNHGTPGGWWREDLARLAVKNAQRDKKIAAQEARKEKATHEEAARNLLLFNKEVQKEAQAIENAAQILMCLGKTKKTTKKSRTIKPIIGKIVMKNGSYSYKKL